MPTIYRCEKPGCGFKTGKVGQIRAHYSKVHHEIWPRDLGLEGKILMPNKGESEKNIRCGNKRYRDPTLVTPMEIMNMSNGERMQWQFELMKYGYVSKMKIDMINSVLGPNFYGPDATTATQNPSLVQELQKEPEDMKRREAMRECLEELKSQIRALKSTLNDRAKANNTSSVDWLDTILVMKMLDT